MHTFDPSALKAEAGGPLEFKANLAYLVNFRTVRAME